jgi:hypothetical protein
LSDAMLILSRFWSLLPDLVNFSSPGKKIIGIAGFGREDIFFSLLLIIGLYISELLIKKKNFRDFYAPKKKVLRWSIYYVLIFLIIAIGVYEKRDFIYFQF